ncbi:hypothetical protein VTJ04DRAFT_5694 [Mycothermus thermophilus]|uniref:uncharacterized protein n=1 Tax=Humicola insolens TaxID=85995 RepID=UPI003743ACA1
MIRGEYWTCLPEHRPRYLLNIDPRREPVDSTDDDASDVDAGKNTECLTGLGETRDLDVVTREIRREFEDFLRANPEHQRDESSLGVEPDIAPQNDASPSERDVSPEAGHRVTTSSGVTAAISRHLLKWHMIMAARR